MPKKVEFCLLVAFSGQKNIRQPQKYSMCWWPGGSVEIEEFLLGCLRLRGSARAMDIAKVFLGSDEKDFRGVQSGFLTFKTILESEKSPKKVEKMVVKLPKW